MHTLVARIAILSGDVPGVETMNTFLRMIFKGSPKLESKSSGPAGLVATFGNEEVAISAVPMAIPFDEIEPACKRSWMWPDAADAMQGAEGHVVCTCKCEDPVDGAKALTKVVSAVLDEVEGIGVHFCSAGTVTEADAFFKQSKALRNDELPLYLWAGFHAFKEEDGTSTIYTTGLSAFDKLEVEAPRASADLETVNDVHYSVVHHVMAGAEFADGDTIDLGDDLTLTVTRGPGRFHPERTVLQLNF